MRALRALALESRAGQRHDDAVVVGLCRAEDLHGAGEGCGARRFHVDASAAEHSLALHDVIVLDDEDVAAAVLDSGEHVVQPLGLRMDSAIVSFFGFAGSLLNAS